jgi:hypothetical protein
MQPRARESRGAAQAQRRAGLAPSELGAAPHTRIGVLAERYPELAAFTADATLLEIKTIHGLSTLEEVRALARRRAGQRRAHARGH